MSQPTDQPERTPEEQAAIDRGGNRWAIGIVLTVIAVVALCMWRTSSSKPKPADELGDAKRVCQEKFIPDRLKAPATAKFSSVTVTQDGVSYLVQGSVDSQNSFGALVRSTFACTVHSSGDQWVLDSAQVNG